MKILIADDDASLRAAVRIILTAEGYEVCSAEDGSRAIEVFEEAHPDLAILDVMMPKLNGFEVCERLRAIRPQVPVLFLSAKGELEDKKTGLRSGADDYMVKPFDGEELLLRIAALLRRSAVGGTAVPNDTAPQCVRIGGLEIHFRRHEVTVDGAKAGLTPKEFQVLALLAEHPGEVFSRDDLVSSLWGEEYTDDNVGIAVYIRRIREKIEKNPSKPQYLQTVWRVGYRLRDPFGE